MMQEIKPVAMQNYENEFWKKDKTNNSSVSLSFTEKLSQRTKFLILSSKKPWWKKSGGLLEGKKSLRTGALQN